MARVLVVDDEVQIADLVRELLEWEQHEVRTAPNGQAALQVLDTFRADLIISDVMMPVMTGIELCHALAAHPAYRTIPVILTSAGLQSVAEAEGHYVVFIKKPFTIPELLETVARYAANSPPSA